MTSWRWKSVRRVLIDAAFECPQTTEALGRNVDSRDLQRFVRCEVFLLLRKRRSTEYHTLLDQEAAVGAGITGAHHGVRLLRGFVESEAFE
jgi:hypothetical protein